MNKIVNTEWVYTTLICWYMLHFHISKLFTGKSVNVMKWKMWIRNKVVYLISYVDTFAMKLKDRCTMSNVDRATRYSQRRNMNTPRNKPATLMFPTAAYYGWIKLNTRQGQHNISIFVDGKGIKLQWPQYSRRVGWIFWKTRQWRSGDIIANYKVMQVWKKLSNRCTSVRRGRKQQHTWSVYP